MRISIIGGGNTGLTTALCLQKLGIDCQVYERATQLNEVGAGIWIQPNAIKVMKWLGIADKIIATGSILDTVEITDNQLQPFKKIAPELIADSQGNKIVSIHRAQLQKILVEALPTGSLHHDYCYQNHVISDNKIEIQFANKKLIETDLVLAADGIHSNVRKQLFEKTEIRHSGQVCYRGIASIVMPTEFKNKAREAWSAAGRFGFAQLSANTVYWYAVVKINQIKKEQTNLPKEQLINHYKDFHPIVNQILENTPADKILKHDLSDLKRLNTWQKGNICLLGDAAHATTPNMGQGAGQGIEDAYYFAHIFAKTKDPKIAFESFEKARRKKVDYVVNTSWRFGQMAHSTLGRNLAKIAMKLTPTSVLLKQTQKLYHLPKLESNDFTT